MNMDVLARQTKRNRRVFFFTTLLMTSLAVLTYVARADEKPNAVIAQVKDQTLRVSELERIHAQTFTAGVMRIPSKLEIQSLWLDQQVGSLEARNLKLQDKPEVARRINAILYDALIEAKLFSEISKLSLGPTEAEEFYKSHPEIHVAHVFMPVGPAASEADAKNVAERLKEIQKTFLEDKKMSFAEVAQRFSLAASATDGGSMGFRASEELDPAIFAAARNLKPGDVAGPIRSQLGYHLIKVLAVKPWGDADPQLAVRRTLEAKKKALVDAYFVGLRKKHGAQSKPL